MVVYSPLLNLLFRATWRVLRGPIGVKLPLVLADPAVVGMLGFWVRETGQRIARLAIYAWNSLVIIEFAGGGHIDSLSAAAMVAAILIIRGRPIVSTMAPAAGALAKFFRSSCLDAARRMHPAFPDSAIFARNRMEIKRASRSLGTPLSRWADCVFAY
jgi:hypothetical protein